MYTFSTQKYGHMILSSDQKALQCMKTNSDCFVMSPGFLVCNPASVQPPSASEIRGLIPCFTTLVDSTITVLKQYNEHSTHISPIQLKDKQT